MTSSDEQQPTYPQSGPWTPPQASAQAPWAPPAVGSVPPPPTQAPWDPAGQPGQPSQVSQAGAHIPPPPVAGYNPTRATRSRGYRGGVRGNGLYSVFAGVISILVVVVSLFIEGGGHFSFLVVLPIAGLIYGIVSIASGNRRGWGILGTILCAVALILEALLFVA